MKSFSPNRHVHTVPNPGDTLILDCGYGLQEDYKPCRVIGIFAANRLFGDGHDLCAQVREPYGSVFNTTLVCNPGNPI